jgi:hypothetical protein
MECLRLVSAVVRATSSFLAGPYAVTNKRERWSLEDYDIHDTSAFFPPTPLPDLPATLYIWQSTLEVASRVLRLGTDISDEGLQLQAAAEHWRQEVRSVSGALYPLC